MTEQSVLIADGNARLATVMGQLLGDEPGYRVVGIAQSAQAALALTQSCRPDIILVSERLEDLPGSAVCAGLRPVAPEATLLLWSHDGGRTQAESLDVDAVLDRGMTFRELLKTISRVRRPSRPGPTLPGPGAARTRPG